VRRLVYLKILEYIIYTLDVLNTDDMTEWLRCMTRRELDSLEILYPKKSCGFARTGSNPVVVVFVFWAFQFLLSKLLGNTVNCNFLEC
jgi:hypothetical protein